MTVRRFKPGDRVQKRGKGQIMIVQKYCLKHHIFYGTYLSDREVECVWYEKGERNTGIFDQRTLTKVSPYNHTMNGLNSLAKQENRADN